MFNKLYEMWKKYIKENYKFLLILIASYIVLTFPLPYYIYTTGGIMNIQDKVTIENGYQSAGTFNFAYVSELRATIPTYLLSTMIPSWERVKIEEYKLNEKETAEDVAFRDKMSLKEANQAAIEVAYQKAGKEYQVIDSHYYVIYVSEESKTNLKVGDEILRLDDQVITSLEQYRAIVSSHNLFDVLEVVVRQGEKEVVKSIEVIDVGGSKMTGISMTTIYDYQTDPKIELHFTKAESGPSGGLMLTLSIYNQLIKEDITKGKKIVGTGTIDNEGNVGEIGGVEYKLRGAAKEKADLFLVPKGENYDTCLKLKEKEHLEIKVVAIETFDDALKALETLK